VRDLRVPADGLSSSKPQSEQHQIGLREDLIMITTGHNTALDAAVRIGQTKPRNREQKLLRQGERKTGLANTLITVTIATAASQVPVITEVEVGDPDPRTNTRSIRRCA
jgi:hypothetical protein